MKRDIIVQGEAILELIPQRKPIVMVDTFYGIEDENSYTGLTVAADNIFVDGESFAEPGIVEHIAQSAAVRIGYIYQQIGQPVPLGFIASVDKLKIHNLPKIGDQLYTEIKVIQEVSDITLIGAVVKLADEVVAEGRIKIFLNKNE